MLRYLKMKISAVILLLVTVCLSLISCDLTSTQNFAAVYFPDSGVIAKNVEIELVTSRDKLESYRKSVLFFNAKDEVMEKLDSYSSEFFDAKMLIVINMTEPISNSNVIVEKVDFGDSKVTVTIKRESPDIGAEVIKHWTVFVEIEACEIEKVDYTIIEKRIS